MAIETVGLLEELGFVEDRELFMISGMSFDFGNFKLHAARLLNLSAVEVVQFAGIMSGSGTLAEIDFSTPVEVESAEFLYAWIVWHLDRSAPRRRFQPRFAADWLEIGRASVDDLPWVKSRKAYAERPRCLVGREWAKLALKGLAALLAKSDRPDAVIFNFDGQVWSLRCGTDLIVTPAVGRAWATAAAVESESLSKLPRRLRRDVCIAVFEGSLTIDSHRYPLIELAIEEGNNR